MAITNRILRAFTRHRSVFLFGGSLVALALSFLSDPDGEISKQIRNSWFGGLGIGLSTLLGGLALVQGIWAIALAHMSRKALADYPEADMRKLFAKAGEGPIGSGLALIAMAITFVGLLMVFAPRAHAADLPAGFYQYGPMLKAEQQHYWSAHPAPFYLAGLVEQESCVSLKSKGCWNPSSRLKTSREEGAGLGQITRAYRADGSLRFDALASLRNQYSEALGEWSWGNVYARPELQERAIVLMSKDAAAPFRAAQDALPMGDSSYNGGPADVQKARRACALTKGCDPSKWFNNVELHCMKSRQPIYGGRSACDINLEHVRNVFLVRSKKYEQAWAAL